MITFKNIAGHKFLAVGTIKRKSALNGEKSLTGTLYDGDDVLNKIDKGWSLEFDNEPYIVTYFERNDNDNSVSFDAIHKFFWDMTKNVLYSETNGSHTIKWYLDQIFANTGYTYALNFDTNAIAKDNWGMKNKLFLFNDIINSIEGEFELNGTLVSIFKNIGTDLSTIVRYGFNLSDMTIENDSSKLVTYGEGFGAYADQESMTGDRLHVSYTSPLANLYGKLEAEPVDDQRYTVESNLLKAVQSQIDSSFSVSVNLSLYDLSVAGYPYKMANVGDWLTAVDENLDFKQRIRIISIGDEFAADGTRISYNVAAGDIGLTKKYQDANASLSARLTEVTESASRASTDANHALITANGKNTSYYLNSDDDLPRTANEGDLAWVKSGDGTIMYIYTKKADGSYYWEKRIDPEMSEQIELGVEKAVSDAKTQTDKAISDNNVLVNKTINDVSKQQADLAIQAGDFNNKAQAMADKALSDAKANTATVAQQTASNAQSALDKAKTDLTTGINKEITDRNSAVTALDTKAKGYADSAKADAISVATTADGVINKKIDNTASSITSTISQNKIDAEGKISTAQSSATQALNELKTKVSKTDYDTKTGQLQADLNTTINTANQSKQDIVAIKNTNSSQDSRMNSIESDASGTKQTVSQLQTVQGQQSGSISTLQQRADGFDATVTKVNNLSVGGRNLLFNTGQIFTGTGNNTVNGNLNSTILILLVNQWKASDLYANFGNVSLTISFDWTATGSGISGKIVPQFNNAPWGILGSPVDISSKSGHYKSTTLPMNDSWNSNTIANAIMFRQDNMQGMVSISNLKLETGNLPTDWTPAPEDVDSATAKAQLTADQATTTISNYKTDADKRISKAQSDVTQTAKDVTTKVSQSDYNAKTGDLNTSVSKAQQTADTAVTTIGNYKTSNDGRISSAEAKIKANSDLISQSVTKSEYNSKTGELSSKVSTAQQTADGAAISVSQVQSKVNNLGRVNSINNSSFTPDLSGWTQSGNGTYSTGDYAYSGGAVLVLNNTAGGINNLYSSPISLNSSQNQTISWSLNYYIFSVGSGGSSYIYIQYLDSSMNAIPNIFIQAKDVSGTTGWNNLLVNNFTLNNPPSNAKYIRLVIDVREKGTRIGINKPMLVFGSSVGDYVPGQYNNNDKIATQQITIDGITSIVSDPRTGLSTRVQTAEGTLSTVKSTADGAMSKATQTANDIKQEISDRSNGDSNTLQSAKTFTQSSISTSETGMKNIITQTSDALITQISSINMVTNSEFDPINVGWYSVGATAGSTVGAPWSLSETTGFKDWSVVNGSKLLLYNVGSWYTSTLQIASAGKVYSGSIVAGRSVAPAADTALDLRIAFWDSSRKIISYASAGNIITGSAYKGIDKYVIENRTAPSGTSFVSLVVAHSSGNVNDIIGKPMLNAGATASPYSATKETTSSTTILALFKDNWSIGITDNIGKITNGIVADSASLSVINKNIILNGDTTVTGAFKVGQANIANGAIGTAQIGEAVITSGKIAYIDANKITTGTLNALTANSMTMNAGTINGAAIYITSMQQQMDGTSQSVRLGINPNWAHQLHIEPVNQTSGYNHYLYAGNDHLYLGAWDGSNTNTYDNRVALFTNGGNSEADIGVVRITSSGSAIYDDGWGRIDGVTSISMAGSDTKYTSLYMGVGNGGTGEFRVVTTASVGGSNPTYADARAAHWYTSSLAKYKTNISEMDKSALGLINSAGIYKWQFKTDVEAGNGKYTFGPVIGEEYTNNPDEFLDSIHEGTDDHSVTWIAVKALQEEDLKVEKLRLRIADLQEQINELKAS